MLAIGMMSGTSLDGIDVALVEFSSDESSIYKLCDFFTVNYPSETLLRINQAMSIEKSNVSLICSLNVELGILYGKAAKRMMEKNNLNSNDISFIANHGQTIYHAPNIDFPSTLQIGEPSEIFEITGVRTVFGFSEADIAAGGQGAPIVPFSEYKIYSSMESDRILVNIGGISNITFLPKNSTISSIVAFDTGPGNMIIDTMMRKFYNRKYDKNGDIAKSGKINHKILNYLMTHPFLQKRYSKSTGREDFGTEYAMKLLKEFNLTSEDWIATITAFTAKSLCKAIDLLPISNVANSELVISGGGSYNKTLLLIIKEFSNMKVLTQEDLGYSSEAKEAIAIVVLGKYCIEGRKNSIPNATGASHQVILEKILR